MMFNEKGIGIVILTNSSSDGQHVISAIRNQIFDKMLEVHDVNWVEKTLEVRMKTKNAINEALDSFNKTNPIASIQPIETYVGRYTHPAYGNVEFKIENNNFFFSYGKTKTLLYFKSEDIFSGQLAELLVYGINPTTDFKFFKDSAAAVYKVEIPFEGFRAAKPITFMREVTK